MGEWAGRVFYAAVHWVIPGCNHFISPLFTGEFLWCPGASGQGGQASPVPRLLFKYFTRGLLHRFTARVLLHFLSAAEHSADDPSLALHGRPSVYPVSREDFATCVGDLLTRVSSFLSL